MLRNWKPPALNVSGLGSSIGSLLTPRTPNGHPVELPENPLTAVPLPELDVRVNGTSQAHGSTSYGSNKPALSTVDDDALLDDDFALPFSAAAQAYRDAYASPDLAGVAQFAPPANSLLFSPGRSVSNRDSIMSSASIETKDDFLLELLSGQALVEAQEFEILPWETVDQLKSEHKEVVDQISRMTNTLASETKMRDAASSLKKQNGARSVLHHPGLERNNSMASLDERVSASSARVEKLSAELYTLKHREITIRTRLLRHIAAVLAATLRRRDSISNAESRRSSVLASKKPVLNGSRRQSAAGPSPLRGHAHFDGAHFFANNRSAVTPLPKGSPRQNGVDPAAHAAIQTEMAERTAEVDKLRDEISRLGNALATSQSSVQSAERQLSSSRADADAQRSALEQMSKRSELRTQSERGALLAALSRHRSSTSPLASCVPNLAATDDAAAAFDAFFQQATAQMQSQASARDMQAGELTNTRADADRHQRRAADAEAQHQRAQAVLQELWSALPAQSSVDVINAAPSALTSAFSSAALPGSSRGLGISNDTASFSHAALLERVRASASANRALANRVAKEHGDGSASKQEMDRMQASLREAQDAAAKAKYQLRDLEARAEAAASQEVASLERLNELQAGFESTRMDKARAERERDNQAERARQAVSERDRLSSEVNELKRQIEIAKNTTSPLKAANEKLEREIEELKQQLTDAQDDLDDMKSRESKQRVALLDELNTAQTEISTLRSQLRAEQRKRAP